MIIKAFFVLIFLTYISAGSSIISNSKNIISKTLLNQKYNKKIRHLQNQKFQSKKLSFIKNEEKNEEKNLSDNKNQSDIE